MKRRIGILLVICITVVLCLAGCATEQPGNSATPSTSATKGNVTQTKAPTATTQAPTSTATATQADTQTQKPTASSGKEKAASDVYTIKFDVSIIQGAAGFIFNGLGNEFLMWQLNYGEIEADKLYFRPHVWGENVACLEDIPIDESLAKGKPGEVMHMEIRMNKGKCETYLNDKLIFTYEAEFYDYDDYCGIGFRADAISASERLECASFDNFVVTNSLGEVIMKEDFEGDTNFFTEKIDEGSLDCEVKDGKLVVGQTEKVLFMEFLPSLNP